jgi:hypothetical protein
VNVHGSLQLDWHPVELKATADQESDIRHAAFLLSSRLPQRDLPDGPQERAWRGPDSLHGARVPHNGLKAPVGVPLDCRQVAPADVDDEKMVILRGVKNPKVPLLGRFARRQRAHFVRAVLRLLADWKRVCEFASSPF